MTNAICRTLLLTASLAGAAAFLGGPAHADTKLGLTDGGEIVTGQPDHATEAPRFADAIARAAQDRAADALR